MSNIWELTKKLMLFKDRNANEIENIRRVGSNNNNLYQVWKSCETLFAF